LLWKDDIILSQCVSQAVGSAISPT
jgi:hypothetical protein